MHRDVVPPSGRGIDGRPGQYVAGAPRVVVGHDTHPVAAIAPKHRKLPPGPLPSITCHTLEDMTPLRPLDPGGAQQGSCKKKKAHMTKVPQKSQLFWSTYFQVWSLKKKFVSSWQIFQNFGHPPSLDGSLGGGGSGDHSKWKKKCENAKNTTFSEILSISHPPWGTPPQGGLGQTHQMRPKKIPGWAEVQLQREPYLTFPCGIT